jgi:hypothetical protein
MSVDGASTRPPPLSAHSRLRIVVTGLIAQHPHVAGIAWHYVQYVLGLARLGHDVYYIEDSGEVPYTLDGGASGDEWVAPDCGANVEHLAATLSCFGLEERWAYRHPPAAKWYGLSASRRREVVRSADLLINVSGSLEHPTRYRCIPRLVYVDTDPVVTQVKYANEVPAFVRRVDAHDLHFSFGERLGESVPSTGHRWHPTRQPIVLSEWPFCTDAGESFSTIMSWTSYAPLRHAGRTYGQKDVEFLRFLELPDRVAPVPLEVVLAGTRHLDWETQAPELPTRLREQIGWKRHWTPGEILEHAGWRVEAPSQVCGDLGAYRAYIGASRAEWSVAKNAYVRGQPGWFSERSACYLASGRPVIVQDTGLAGVLPIGEGILPFRSLEQAADAILAVDGDYARHSKAARLIAEEYFSSDSVLTRLVEEAMTAPTGEPSLSEERIGSRGVLESSPLARSEENAEDGQGPAD